MIINNGGSTPPFAEQSITSEGLAIDWDMATYNLLNVTLANHNQRINNPTGYVNGGNYTLNIIQNDIGGFNHLVFGDLVLEGSAVVMGLAWQSGNTVRCEIDTDLTDVLIDSSVTFSGFTDEIWNKADLKISAVTDNYFEFSHSYITDATYDTTESANLSIEYSMYTFINGLPSLDLRAEAINNFTIFHASDDILQVNYQGNISETIEEPFDYNSRVTEDFIIPVHTSDAWGLASNQGGYYYPASITDHLGILRLHVYSGTGHYITLTKPKETRSLDSASFTLEAIIKLYAKPNNNFSVILGFGDSVYDKNGLNNGVYFQITDTNWLTVCMRNSTKSTKDCGIPAQYSTVMADAWVTFKMSVTSNSCKFYIDNILVSTMTSNIPTNKIFPFLNLGRVSGGSTTDYCYWDKVKFIWQTK